MFSFSHSFASWKRSAGRNSSCACTVNASPRHKAMDEKVFTLWHRSIFLSTKPGSANWRNTLDFVRGSIVVPLCSPFMKAMRPFLIASVVASCLLVSCATRARHDRQMLSGATRVLFLGDSITHSGQYVEFIEAYFITRFPDRKLEILNLGLPSETVSGLSEPGHAGGQFPRPDLH